MYYIHFYNRSKGTTLKKTGYGRKEDAERDLRKNKFFPVGGDDVWDSAAFIARIKEDTSHEEG